MKYPSRPGGVRRFAAVTGLVLPAVVALAALVPGAASAQTHAPHSGRGLVTSNTYSKKAGSGPAPASSGKTVDPLRYDCTYPSGSGSCQRVGLTHGYYRGSTLNFLYTARFYCDKSVPAKSSTGCEAGASYHHLPPYAASQDPLYILVPLGFKAKGLQCAKVGNCIDHPGTMDLTRLASVLDPILGTKPAQLRNAPLSPHSHFITTRNHNLPEWWNVKVIGVTSRSSYQKAVRARSYGTLKAMEGKNGVTKPIATNTFLYFQTLAGTNGAALKPYHGTAGPQAKPGQPVNPLVSSCATRGPCSARGIGLTRGFLSNATGSATGNILYTENYFCDKSVPAKSATGCEAGAGYRKLPPGTTKPVQQDPLYIITPLGFKAPGLQCPRTGYCIDHPGTVDLTRLAPVLDPILGTKPAQLRNAPLSPHSHVVLTANYGQPQWWNVKVIGVTKRSSYNKIISASDKYREFEMLAAGKKNGVTKPISTNIFLWFQVLPGAK